MRTVTLSFVYHSISMLKASYLKRGWLRSPISENKSES